LSVITGWRVEVEVKVKVQVEVEGEPSSWLNHPFRFTQEWVPNILYCSLQGIEQQPVNIEFSSIAVFLAFKGQAGRTNHAKAASRTRGGVYPYLLKNFPRIL